MTSTQTGAIFFLTGPPGVGKSTVAKALANRFDRAIHIELDRIRLNVVKGLSLPGPGNMTEETTSQLNLAHVSAGLQAKTYADAGFVVVVEHASHAEYIEKFKACAGLINVVCLNAETDVNIERNALRASSSLDAEGLALIIPMLAAGFRDEFESAGIPSVDSTHLSVEETVDQILNHV
jgi:adenylylsulfate kinase-like enzyme